MTRWIADPRSASALVSSESAPSSELTPDSRVRVRVRRPKQQVVVRAGSAPQAAPGSAGVAPSARGVPPSARGARWSRSDTPTLIGLDVRERQDTLSEVDAGGETGWGDLENDWAGETKTLLALKRRPVVLREDTDAELVEEYRRQAQALLDSGLFGPHSVS